MMSFLDTVTRIPHVPVIDPSHMLWKSEEMFSVFYLTPHFKESALEKEKIKS